MNETKDNLSDKQLKRSYWYLLHRSKIIKIGLIIFIIIDVILVFIAIFGLVRYLNNSAESEQLSVQSSSYIDWQAYHQANQPQDLQFDSVKVIKTESGKADIGVLVHNFNDVWGVSKLTYQFILNDGQVTPSKESFLLPGQSKYLLALNIETASSIANLQVVDLNWQRVKKESLPTINISEEDFISASKLAGQDFGGQASWLVTNNSAVSYYDVGFEVVLFSNKKPVAFNYIEIPSLDSLVNKELTVSWTHKLSNITSLEVTPIVNIFDPSFIK